MTEWPHVAEWQAAYQRRHALQNAAKQEAVRIVWAAREQCSPGSTAAKFLSRVIDHLFWPEAWS